MPHYNLVNKMFYQSFQHYLKFTSRLMPIWLLFRILRYFFFFMFSFYYKNILNSLLESNHRIWLNLNQDWTLKIQQNHSTSLYRFYESKFMYMCSLSFDTGGE